MGVGGQCLAPAALLPGKSVNTHCTGGWVGPRANIEWCEEEQLSCPTRGSNPEQSSLWRVVIQTMLPWPLYSSAYNIIHMELLVFCQSGWSLLRNLGTITHFHMDEDIWMLLFNTIIVISSKAMWKAIYKNISFCNEIWPVKIGVAMEL